MLPDTTHYEASVWLGMILTILGLAYCFNQGWGVEHALPWYSSIVYATIAFAFFCPLFGYIGGGLGYVIDWILLAMFGETCEALKRRQTNTPPAGQAG